MHKQNADTGMLRLTQEQAQKLRQEYLGLGGSANSPIPNYFLYIILGISFLAVRDCGKSCAHAASVPGPEHPDAGQSHQIVS